MQKHPENKTPITPNGHISPLVLSEPSTKLIATAPEKGGEAGESGVSHMAEGQSADASTPPLPFSPA